MRVAKKTEPGKTYQTYNKMELEDEKGNTYVGNTYILEEGVIIAIFEGVKVSLHLDHHYCPRC